MKKLWKYILAVSAATLTAAAIAMPANAEASGIHKAAKRECKQERRTDTQEFINEYGGKGRKALKRCIRHEKRSARRECKHERRTETQEFVNEYGGKGRKALKRCIIDEIR